MSRVRSVIRPDVLAMSAYHVADASGLIKLDVMENPYRLPEALAKDIAALVAGVAINRYPIPSAERLRALIRQTMQVPAGCDVVLGNGSDDCIQYLTAAVAREGAVVMAPSPSFVMFQMQANFFRLPFVGVPLREDFSIDIDAFLQAIAQHQPALVWIAFPNNPTGNAFALDDIEKIVRAAPGLVVIDEAYQPFAGASFMSRLNEFDQLVVMRTLSKVGLAGLRLGYLAGRSEWIAEFNKTRPPFNLNVLTEAVAIRLLENKSVLDDMAARVLTERERIAPLLRGLTGLTVYPSAANFILVRVNGAPGRGTRVFNAMKADGVLVKDFSGGHPSLQNCLRLTIGAPDENNAMIRALKHALE